MNDKSEYALVKLEQGFAKLEEGVKEATNELQKDGVIKRFEFTFELCWKALKIYLEFEGITVKTPRESMQEAFRIGLITEEALFLNMLEDRNKTSHIYNKETSEEIFARIKDKYVQAFKGVITALQDKA